MIKMKQLFVIKQDFYSKMLKHKIEELQFQSSWNTICIKILKQYFYERNILEG